MNRAQGTLLRHGPGGTWIRTLHGLPRQLPNIQVPSGQNA